MFAARHQRRDNLQNDVNNPSNVPSITTHQMERTRLHQIICKQKTMKYLKLKIILTERELVITCDSFNAQF